MARKLRNIKIEEVSFVDVPANKKRFLFFKEDERRKPAGDESFARKTYEVNTMKLIDIFKSYMSTEITEEEIEKDTALKDALTVLEKWDADLPEEVKAAFKTIQKRAEGDMEKCILAEVEKAGAKLSKETIKAIKDAAKMLINLLPEADRVLKTDATPEEQIITSLADIASRLETLEKGDDKGDPKDDKGGNDIVKMLEDIGKRLEVVEAAKGVKKGIETDGEGDKTEVDEWPSIKL